MRMKMFMILGLMFVMVMASCASIPRDRYNTQKGAAIGAGAGALIGQAIGHNTKGTLIGLTAGYGLYRLDELQREMEAGGTNQTIRIVSIQPNFTIRRAGVPVVFGNNKKVNNIDTVLALSNQAIRLGTNYVLAGAMDEGRCKEFDHIWTEGLRTDPPAIDYEKAEKEFLDVAEDFYQSHSNMAAMVLECTGFPPFARALQRKIDIPIFSWGTLLDYAFSVVVHRDYYGHV